MRQHALTLPGRRRSLLALPALPALAGAGLLLCAGCAEKPATPPSAQDMAQPVVNDLSVPVPKGLLINEVFPHGDDELLDPDWVELKNTGDTPVDLTGHRVRDARSEVPLPAGTMIAPGAYLLLYCDDVPDGAASNRIHLPFKLGGSGDEFSVFKADGTKVDGVTWGLGVVPSNKSYGRLPDGAGPFAPLTPTPGSRNGT